MAIRRVHYALLVAERCKEIERLITMINLNITVPVSLNKLLQFYEVFTDVDLSASVLNIGREWTE